MSPGPGRVFGPDRALCTPNWYGILNEILELVYLGEPSNRVVLFRCEWYDPARPRGTRSHKDYQITEVNSRLMTRGDRGQGRGDRGRGTGGRRGRPRRRTGIPLDLGDTEAETSTPPPVTQTPVIPTPSLSEGLPAMRMIPTPGSRVQSSETTETRSQRTTPTQTTTGSEDPPPPEPDPMSCPPVNNPLPEGEEEDIAMEQELA
ncbi:hypothetical protein PIB30_030852 [Stylosanthes scabra]|uniref:DUF4216 domain-containing protein n=1 Tax=Stylosanthes scabra TaxID=79078 RepID=A0ABU6UC19_9FABA|nr:hypothetical protein [Stylosanthes scabra]